MISLLCVSFYFVSHSACLSDLDSIGRDREPSIPVSVLSQPLSPSYLRECGGSADSVEIDRNISQRGADISRIGSDSGFNLSASPATPYSPSPLHTIPVSHSFHNSARTCAHYEANEASDTRERRRHLERIGVRNTLSRVSDIDTDTSICNSQDGWDADYGEDGRVEIVVAEHWVSCIYCIAENPPLAVRCEVCYGPLTSSVRVLDNLIDT